MFNNAYLRLFLRLLALSLCLAFTTKPLLAEDMWEGVFTYQKKMADYGNPEAQVKLGEMYEEGHGTEQDYEMARQWYQKAADQDYDPAKEKLIQLEVRKQRETEAAKRAEQERVAREKAEQERLAREKAEAEERARKAQLERERQAREAEQKRQAEERAAQEAEQKRQAEERAAKEAEEKARSEEEERLARERARKAMKEMMSTPSGYTAED